MKKIGKEVKIGLLAGIVGVTAVLNSSISYGENHMFEIIKEYGKTRETITRANGKLKFYLIGADGSEKRLDDKFLYDLKSGHLKDGTRTLIALKDISDNIEGVEIKWDQENDGVEVTGKEKNLFYPFNKRVMLEDDSIKEMDMSATVDPVSNRSYLPFRSVLENLGYRVEYVGFTNSVYVLEEGASLPKQKGLTQESVYETIMDLKKEYPEGMSWDNSNKYSWKGGIYGYGYGCAGFAFLVSDRAFSDLPARRTEDFTNLRVGDIVRVNNDSHSVVVLKIEGDTVIITEGNFNSSIKWGRKLPLSEITESGNYILTRYPN